MCCPRDERWAYVELLSFSRIILLLQRRAPTQAASAHSYAAVTARPVPCSCQAHRVQRAEMKGELSVLAVGQYEQQQTPHMLWPGDQGHEGMSAMPKRVLRSLVGCGLCLARLMVAGNVSTCLFHLGTTSKGKTGKASNENEGA